MTREDEAHVERLARAITNIKGVSGLENIKRAVNLPSGGQAIATDMGGVFRIIVIGKDEPEQIDLHDGLASSSIPMLFSGAITKHTVKEGEGVGIKLTEQCRVRLAGYQGGKDKRPPKDVELKRFVVEYGDGFKYFEPDIKGIYTFTQYHRHRPTWYSGAMTELMQVVGGYGIQKFDELPESDLERAAMKPPAKVYRKIEEEIGNIRLPGYKGTPPEDGKFVLDYKFSKTNGVSFDSSGSPWLVQVDSSGLHVMPLPIIPATSTNAFREWMEEVGDTEILKLIDRFGGMPSGEGFPIGAAFHAWRRAGAIIKIAETGDFYSKQAMYDACGWSFNSSGSEGYNTCHDQMPNGLRKAYGYKMGIRLEPAESNGKLPHNWQLDDPAKSRLVDEYLASIYRQAHSDDAEGLAVKYKLRRHTGLEILAAASAGNDYTYWVNLDMPPIASHSGYVSKVAEGNMWWPKVVTQFGLVPSHQAPKFPTLSGEGCESLDMVNMEYEGPPVRCDTILFGCYIEDKLRVIKYFRDEREFYKKEESTFEDLMIVGQWEKTVTSGTSGLAGLIYTTDEDDRKEISPTVTHTEVVGTDLGYGQPTYYGAGTLFMNGSVSRSRYYEHKTTIETTTGSGISCGALVPVFARDSILYAQTEGSTSWKKEMETSRKSMADPTSYGSWTYDPIFHWLGRSGKGEPRPKTGTPVFLDEVNYSPFPGSDFSDSGDWMGVGDSWLDITSVIGWCTDRSTGTTHGGGCAVVGQPPGWQKKSSSEQKTGKSSGRVSITIAHAGHKRAHNDLPEQWYYQFSPVDAGGAPHYMNRDAAWIACGEAAYVSVSEKRADGRRTSWGKSEIADFKTAQHFIGVINE